MNIGKPSSNFIQLPFMKRRDTPDPEKKELRLPLIGFLPNKVRNHFIAMVGEFCGTFLFLFFAFAGTQVANSAAAANTAFNAQNSDGSLAQAPNAPVLLYIALAFGFSLAVNVWIFFRISGGRMDSIGYDIPTLTPHNRSLQSSCYSRFGYDRCYQLGPCRPCVHR
jgi:aquaporin related protein